MTEKQEYDSRVKRLNSATVAAIALALGSFCLCSSIAAAQINGAPASVTSINFGGHLNSAPGVPASVTSLGPNGLQPNKQMINPMVPANPNPPLFERNRHRRRPGGYFPAGGAVYVPYPVVADPEATAANQDADDDRGGPTIFDRRGSGQAARSYLDIYPSRMARPQADTEPAPAPSTGEAPVADLPQTMLVFKDGHQLEVQNYAVVGDMLYDLTPGRYHKIAIADLDLSATAKQNDDRGIDFRLPTQSETSK